MGNNSPINNPFDSGDSYDKVRMWITLGGGIILCIGALVGLIGIGLVPALPNPVTMLRNSPLVVQLLVSPTATATSTETPPSTPTPTATVTPSPTPNLTATQRALDTTSTAVSVEATATKAVSWPIIFSDTFDKLIHPWRTGASDNAYAKMDFEIHNGKYLIDATAHQGFEQDIRISTPPLGDFFISVDAGQISGTSNASYGLILREDTNGDSYYFAINNNTQEYSLDKYSEGQWSEVIRRTYSSAIAKGKPGPIAVLAQGNQFILFINDQFMAETNDVTIAKGTTGLAIDIDQANQQGSFEFDNVVLRAP